MKVNTPVTQREKAYPKGQYLVSRTDLKGITTYANDAFVALSGFSREELIGKNHNIVRHPDMPPQAFADLWRTVQQGLPWRGIVKNRCKDGDHYWVDAFVVPVREDDRISGFMSVRSEPSRAQIAGAEKLYEELRRSGRAIPRTPWWGRLSVAFRLRAMMVLMTLIIVGSVAVGLVGLRMANDGMNTIYRDDMATVTAFRQLGDLAAQTRAQLLLGLQHDPVSPFADMHDHPLEQHTRTAEGNAARAEPLWTQVRGANLPASVQEALGRLHEQYAAYRAVVDRVVQFQRSGAFLQANRLIVTDMQRHYQDFERGMTEISAQLEDHAATTHHAANERYRIILLIMVVGLFVAIVTSVLGGWYLIRSLMRPLNQAIQHFNRMGQGSLVEDIDIDGRDETGLLLCAQAAMQVSLKVMLDEISSAVSRMETGVAEVRTEMRRVVEQSQSQNDRIQGVAAAAEEFSQSVQGVADSATTAASSATRAQQVVRSGTSNMQESMSATNRVVDSVRESGATIGNLNDAVQKIGDISLTIKDIADQTNLLALNAAIEAARAGEQGRGFAVVADEVRKLAERTTSSTADINRMVDTIQSVTREAVSSMNQAVTEVEQGIGAMQASRDNLSEINAASEEVNRMAVHIAEAAAEQATASQEVAGNIEMVSQLIDENTEAARHARRCADELGDVADELRGLAARFRLVHPS